MSSVSGVGATSYVPINIQTKQPVANQQPTAPQVQPTGKDADGDNDGSKGGRIDTYA